MMIQVTRKPSTPTYVMDMYRKFAAARQDIFFNRLAGKPALTTDPILLRHKFTNAYRAADRVSQYLIREIIYQGDQSPDELLFRILLFKLFNKIETLAANTELNEYLFSDKRLFDEIARRDEEIAAGSLQLITRSELSQRLNERRNGL